MSSINRERYLKAKEAARIWYDRYMKETEEKELLREELVKWKKLSENLPDAESLQELEGEVRTHEKTIRKMKKDFMEKEEQHKNIISSLNRDKILAEGRIQQLEEARRDMKERYDELKQDYREQRKHLP